MNNDAFESRLQRTPLQQPPGEWREEILAHASGVAADVNRRTSPTRQPASAARWKVRLRELFWPHPVAWGVMAALWMAFGAVHLVLHEPGQTPARVHIATSSDMPTLMLMQRELLALWEEPADRPRTTPVRPIPPQSCIERRRLTLAA